MQKNLLAMLLVIPLALWANTGRSGALRDLMSEAGIEWLVGAWAGTDSEERSVQLDYQPDLDGHAGIMAARFDNRTIKAIIAVDPHTQEVKLFGACSSGALVTGTWSEEWGDVVLTTEWKLPDGAIAHEQYVHRSIDANTLRVQVYDVTGGYRTGAPKQEVKLNKRNPDQPTVNSNLKG